MEEKLQQLSNIVKSLNDVNQTFYTEVLMLTNDNAVLTVRNEKANAENKELIAKLKTMTEENHRIIDTFNVIHQEVKEKKQALDKREEHFNQEKEKAVNVAKQEKETEKNSAINQLKSEYNRQINSLNGTISQQTTEIIRLTNEKKSLNTEIENLKNDKKLLTNSNNTLRKKISEKDGKINEKDNAIRERNEEIKNKENYYKEIVANKDAEIKEKDNKIKEQTKTIETQQGTISKQEEEIDGYKDKIEKQEKEIKSYKSKELKSNMLSKTHEESMPNDTHTRYTLYEQYSTYDSENGSIESQSIVAHGTTVTDDTVLVDDIRSQYQGEIDNLNLKITELEETNSVLRKQSQKNRELRIKAENEKKALTSHLVSIDKWKIQDVEKIIEDGMKRLSENNSQGSDVQNNDGYKNEYNPY